MLTNNDRKRMADSILYEYGLLKRLTSIGKPHIIGSYKMDMMAWNDLDIDIENQKMSLEKLYELTDFILHTFHPLWYEAKEEVTDEGKTVWFHGFHTLINEELWNIDLWFFDEITISKAEQYCENIISLCEKEPKYTERIIQLKQELIRRELYGFYQYASMDVYRGVLEQKITNIDDFLKKYEKKPNRL